MSVSSMANLAFARRADVEPEGEGLKTRAEVATAKEGPGGAVSSAVSAIAAYIPTEIVTVYVAVLATLGVTRDGSAAASGVTTTPILAYAVFVVLTPLVVWGLYASRAVGLGKPLPRSFASWPKWEMVAATLAFASWAAALPSSPLERYDWFTAALAGVVALVLSMLIGLFAPLFSSKALATK